MLERCVRLTGLLIVQGRLAVREGSTAHILACKTDTNILIDERRIRQRLCEPPITRKGTSRHLPTVFVGFFHLPLHDEPRRNRVDLLTKFLKTLHREAGVMVGRPLMAEVGCPVNEQLAIGFSHQSFYDRLTRVECRPVSFFHTFRISIR